MAAELRLIGVSDDQEGRERGRRRRSSSVQVEASRAWIRNAERTSAADIARAAGACSAYLRDAPNFAVTEIVVLVAESMEQMRA